MGTTYFLEHPVIGILSNLPVLLGALALLLLALPSFSARLERRPAAWTGAAFVLTRVVFALLVVVRMRHVSLDLGTYFATQGWAVLAGDIPYRDFASSYAPLFPYLMALPSLARNPYSFYVFFILCDLAALSFVLRSARAAFPGEPPNAGRARAARAGWIYAAAPVTWYFLVRYGQDEALAAAALAGAFLATTRGREVLTAFLLAFGFAATKFTFALFIPPFLLAARKPFRMAFLTAAAAVLLFAPFLVLGVPVWRPLFAESAGLGFGPSIWRLPIVFTPFRADWPVTLALAAGVVLAWSLPVLLRRPLPLEAHLLLTGCVFLVLSPKVMPMYVTPFWPFAALWAAKKPGTSHLLLLAVVNVLLGTWWYFDAGGINGMFGPWVQFLSAAVTAAVPVTLALLAARVWQDSRLEPGQAVLHFEHVRTS